MKWYITVLKKYADFNGRARRKEYWMFLLFSTIISFVLGFVFAMLGDLTGIGPSLANIVNVVYSLAILIPSVAVAIRRMHDIGRRGWWILVPIVNIIFLCFDSQPHENQYGPNPKALAS